MPSHRDTTAALAASISALMAASPFGLSPVPPVGLDLCQAVTMRSRDHRHGRVAVQVVIDGQRPDRAGQVGRGEFERRHGSDAAWAGPDAPVRLGSLLLHDHIRSCASTLGAHHIVAAGPAS